MDIRIFVEPQQGASYAQQLAVAQRAEQLEFRAFFRSDHFLRMGDGSALPGPTDSRVTLGAIARETSTIRLGTLVEKLDRFARIGMTRIYPQALDMDDLEHLDLLAAEVLPAAAEIANP